MRIIGEKTKTRNTLELLDQCMTAEKAVMDRKHRKEDAIKLLETSILPKFIKPNSDHPLRDKQMDRKL